MAQVTLLHNMKKLIAFLLLTPSLLFGAVTITYPSGDTVVFAAGSTLTLSGSFGGTPTAGTLDLTNVTLTLGTGTASTINTGVFQIGGVSVTSSAAELNVLDGIPAGLTATEIGYSDGVTSAIQTQMDLKAPLAAPTFTGAVTLAESASVRLDVSLADSAYTGITVAGTAGATLIVGDVVYLDPTDSRWELVDANAALAADGDARGSIGICVLAAASDGSATTILLQGTVRADAAFPTFTINAPIYASETAGDATNTSPTTEDAVVRSLGWGIDGNTIYFDPSGTWITYDVP